jgi:hypothetical protein
MMEGIKKHRMRQRKNEKVTSALKIRAACLSETSVTKNRNVKGKFVPVPKYLSMKTYGALYVMLHTFLISTSDRSDSPKQ